MVYMHKFLIWTFFIYCLIGCNSRVSGPPDSTLPDSLRIQIPAFGELNSLEIISWNIQNFPKLDDVTISNVVEIIRDLDVDIIAMQEISDTVSFRKLVNEFNNYRGIYSTDIYSSGNYQKTAILFKKNIIQVSGRQMLFTDDNYIFPRPPMEISVTAVKNSIIFDFNLIVLHLKASGGTENEARRRSACNRLKEYLDSQLLASPDKDYIIVGDWNDLLSDPPAQNVFQTFLSDSLNYRFLTRSITNDYSYLISPYTNLIDHILISANVLPEYSGGNTKVIKIDDNFKAYVNEVSDHRPVGSIFPVFQ